MSVPVLFRLDLPGDYCFVLPCRLLSRFYDLRVQANYVNPTSTSRPCYACLGSRYIGRLSHGGILASIKVRDACDNVVVIDFDRFMKQIMSAHFAVFEMVEQSGLVFLRAVHLTGQCTHTALLITA